MKLPTEIELLVTFSVGYLFVAVGFSHILVLYMALNHLIFLVKFSELFTAGLVDLTNSI